MEIKIIDKKTEKTEGKKPLVKQKEDEEIIILDNESRDKFIELINNLAAKVDIIGSLNKLIDKIDLLQKINLDKIVKIIKKVMEN